MNASLFKAPSTLQDKSDKTMQKWIHTNRLVLEILSLSDYPFIQELVNTKGWLQFIGDRNIHTSIDAMNYIHKINSSNNFTYWVVKTKEANRPVGIISLIKRPYLQYPDLGFAFLPGEQGKGYAFEAAETVLLTISGNSSYAIVLAATLPTNASSIRLLTNLGFVPDKEIEVENKKLCLYAYEVKQNFEG